MKKKRTRRERARHYFIQAQKRKRRKEKKMSKKELEKKRRAEIRKKEDRMRNEIEKVMREANKKGLTYKETGKSVRERTLKNNISTANGLFKSEGIHTWNDFTKEKVMSHLENLRTDYENGDVSKGGLITNRIYALERLYASVKSSNSISEKAKEKFLKNGEFINQLDEWKKQHKIVKSKASSSYLQPDEEMRKRISDRFSYLLKSRSDDENVKLAHKYHRFASITASRIDQAINATLKNLEKLEDGRYIYKVFEGECKTGKPRIKIIDNKHDINFLDELREEAEARADRRGHAYLFDLKINGDRVSRKSIKERIGRIYREEFKNHTETVERNVKHQKNKHKITKRFVPHSSRAIAVEKELKSRVLRYQRSKKAFEKDLNEMIKHDNSKGIFKFDKKGAVHYSYKKLKERKKRELTAVEKAMLLTSLSAGHNRISVMREHYLSEHMKNWLDEKEKNT